MNEHAYRNELDRVSYTPEGREALVTALMHREGAAQKGRRAWRRRWAAAAVAAALLVGTAAAASVSLWDRYFGSLTEEERSMVESLSGALPAAVTSNGTTMAPLSAFGDGTSFYILLEVTAPEGTEFSSDENYALFGKGFDPDHRACLLEQDGSQTEGISYSIDASWMEVSKAEQNKLSMVVSVTASESIDGKTLHIPGLWLQESAVVTGSWDFPLSAQMGSASAMEVKAAGTTTSWIGGTLTLETLRVSPLGLTMTYRYDPEELRALEEREAAQSDMVVTAEDGSAVPMMVEYIPTAQISLVLRDGSQVCEGSAFMGGQDGLRTLSTTFERPVDLSSVDYILWGETKIPLS